MLEIKTNYCKKFNSSELRKIKYPDMISGEYYFSIIVNGNVFFEEPLFPVVEFLHYYVIWKENNEESKNVQKSDFLYSSIETEDNPLISFKKYLTFWTIDSPWKKFDCDYYFECSEFMYACDKLIL